MSVCVDAEWEAKLTALQCHFTWDIGKADIKNLKAITEELLDHLKFYHHRYHGIYYNLLAYTSHLEGDHKTALRFLREAKKELKKGKDGPNLLVTYSNYAWIAYHAGNMDQIKHYLKKLNAIFKAYPEASVNPCNLPIIYGEKGWTFLRLGLSITLAKESFEKALKWEPESVSLNVGYALLLGRLTGRFKEKADKTDMVASQLRKALVLEPENVEVMALLAVKLQSQETDQQEATGLIKKILSLSPLPDVSLVTNHVAEFFKMEGSIEESLNVLRKAVELTPTSFFLHFQIGLWHKRLLIQTLENRRQQPEWRRRTTRKEEEESKLKATTAECIHHFSRAVELKPSNTSAQVKLAEAYADNLQLEEATEIFLSLEKDQSLEESDRQHVLCSYGCFLIYKRRTLSAAVTQLKAAYQIPVHRGEKIRAEQKLRLIADWWSKDHPTEAQEILTFLFDQDRWEREERQTKERSPEEKKQLKMDKRERRRQERELRKKEKKEKKERKKENEKQKKKDFRIQIEELNDDLTHSSDEELQFAFF